jgi:hypothetical protein
MEAKAGDRIVIKGHRTPYLVLWGGSDHNTLFFPGRATVQSYSQAI